jgi:pimeloyl-ACP methyl ester carboxylesterase
MTSSTVTIESMAGADGVSLTVAHRAALAEGGQRRGILLLHGWPGTRLDWAPVLAALDGDSRWNGADLVVPDLRGYGDSDRPPVYLNAQAPYAAYTPAAHTADCVRLIDELGWEHVLIGAYDLGANLAQALARTLPDRVDGLVLHDPVHPAARAQVGAANLTGEWWYQALNVQPWAGDLIGHDRQTVEIYLRHFYTHWWGDGAVGEEHFQQIVDAYARPGAFEASIAWYRSRAASRGKEAADAAAAEKLATPSVILWGEKDPVTPVLFAESLADSFEDWELRRLPGVGHFGPQEAPQELAVAFTDLATRVGWPQ